ncbi:MAG TPA: hypothetical protein VFZ54_02095 [Burkholderiales bacterium]
MRIERLIPCQPRELWRALIQHAELADGGPVLRLALPGGVSANAGKITLYKSERVLECCWGIDVLRWELHERESETLLVFTHAENAAPWLACLDSLVEGLG